MYAMIDQSKHFLVISSEYGGNTVLVVEPDYLPDSEVLAFSRVYTP
jgi:hypothetical protein